MMTPDPLAFNAAIAAAINEPVSAELAAAHERISELEKHVNKIASVARNAIAHVGYANYADREAEAMRWVREAQDAALNNQVLA